MPSIPFLLISCRLHRELRLCKEGGAFGAEGLSVLLANMSSRNACFKGEICLIKSGSSAHSTTLSSSCRHRFFHPLCPEFAEQIDVGAAKGWVRYLEKKDVTDGGFSVGEDGWLKISVKITLMSHQVFTNALPPILRRLSTHHLPKIDSGTQVRYQGANRFLRTAITVHRLVTEGIGRTDKINHYYRLTTNKWFARYEVRDPRSPSDCDDVLCLNSCLCIDLSWNRRSDRSSPTRSRWKTDYGAKKAFLRSSDVACLRCIGIKRDEDRYLCACFSSKNEIRVEVQFGFELVNHYKNAHSKRTGKGNGF